MGVADLYQDLVTLVVNLPFQQKGSAHFQKVLINLAVMLKAGFDNSLPIPMPSAKSEKYRPRRIAQGG